jgi:hypothetical protein
VILNIIKRCFPEKLPSAEGRKNMQVMIPSYDEHLSQTEMASRQQALSEEAFPLQWINAEPVRRLGTTTPRRSQLDALGDKIKDAGLETVPTTLARSTSGVPPDWIAELVRKTPQLNMQARALLTSTDSKNLVEIEP